MNFKFKPEGRNHAVNPKTRNSSRIGMLLLLATVLTIMVGGCNSAGKAPQNGPGTGDSSSSKEPGAITVYLDGRKLASAGREMNGTVYLPVGILFPDEKQPPIEYDLIRFPPAHAVEVKNSRYSMRAGFQDIVPRVEVVDGQVLAPLSFFRFDFGMRARWDPVARTVSLTREPRADDSPYPEEIPEEVARWADQPGEGPRVAVFKSDSGGTFYVFGKKGGALRFRNDKVRGDSHVHVSVAGEGEPGRDVVIGVRPRYPDDPVFHLSFSPDDRAGIYLGLIPWDHEDYKSEVAGGQPLLPRDKPVGLVRARADMLGLGADDMLEEVFRGMHEPSGREMARVRILHGGEEFNAHLFKESRGWVLSAVTWGDPCSQFTLYCAD